MLNDNTIEIVECKCVEFLSLTEAKFSVYSYERL